MNTTDDMASAAAWYAHELRAALAALESSQLRYGWPAQGEWMRAAWAVAGYRIAGLAVPPDLRGRLQALGYPG